MVNRVRKRPRLDPASTSSARVSRTCHAKLSRSAFGSSTASVAGGRYEIALTVDSETRDAQG